MHGSVPKTIPVELLLSAYRSGIFPMADSREDDEVYWVEPHERAIIPLDGFRCSRSLAKAIRQERFRVTIDTCFGDVMRACAAPRPGHPDSWINDTIFDSYLALHEAGYAHSVECWLGDELAGGLYGVSFERAFCGESMFSRERDASKVALGWLVALMRRAGYRLLDCQFMTLHLASLGAISISREDYRIRLAEAIAGGRAQSLPEAYSDVLADAAGASDNAGSVGSAVGAGADGRRGSSLSSPGKLIAQSLTQTS